VRQACASCTHAATTGSSRACVHITIQLSCRWRFTGQSAASSSSSRQQQHPPLRLSLPAPSLAAVAARSAAVESSYTRCAPGARRQGSSTLLLSIIPACQPRRSADGVSCKEPAVGASQGRFWQQASFKAGSLGGLIPCERQLDWLVGTYVLSCRTNEPSRADVCRSGDLSTSAYGYARAKQKSSQLPAESVVAPVVAFECN
jgi:hypothetical protein